MKLDGRTVYKIVTDREKNSELDSFTKIILILFSKAGIIEEMLEDTFEGLEDDDLEEAADEEVEKILFEVTAGSLNNWSLILL